MTQEDSPTLKLYVAMLSYVSAIDSWQASLAQKRMKTIKNIIDCHPEILITPDVNIVQVVTKLGDEIDEKHMEIIQKIYECEFEYFHDEYDEDPNYFICAPIHIASILGNSSIIQTFLHKCPQEDHVLMQDCMGRTILYYAVSQDDNETARILLEHNQKLATIYDNFGTLPINASASNGNFEMCQMLYNSYPDGISYSDENGMIPLRSSILSGRNLELFQFLLDAYPEGVLPNSNSGVAHDSIADEVCESWFNPTCLQLVLEAMEFKELFSLRTYHAYYGSFHRANTAFTFIDISHLHLTYVEDNTDLDLLLADDINDIYLPNGDLEPKTQGETKITTWRHIVAVFGRGHMVNVFENASEYPILHESIGMSTLKDIDFILRHVNPYSTYFFDEDGRNAILVTMHKAINQMNHWDKYFKPLLKMLFAHARREIEMMDEDHHMMDIDDYDYAYAYLLDRNSGSYFLNIAVEIGMSWTCCEFILSYNMDLLNMYDEKTGLIPFMLGCVDSSKSGLSTCYQLLRTKPDVLKMIMDTYF